MPTRKVTEEAVGAAGGAAIGYGAVSSGAAVGSLIFPGPGTIIGATVGGVFSAVAGRRLAKGIASAAFDEMGYDYKEFRCRNCGKNFKCRVYTEQSKNYCEKCA